MKFTNENIPREIIQACSWREKRQEDPEPDWHKIGNIVYSKFKALNYVFANQKYPYVLVTEDGDYTAFHRDNNFYCVGYTNGYPVGYFGSIPDNVIKWYGTNLNIGSNKIEILPFGTLKKHADHIIKEPLKNPKEKELLYINFNPTTSYRRTAIFPFVKELKFGTVEWPPNNVPEHVYERYFLNYVFMVSMHKFTLCPEGCGVDTFRMWEALSLGSIPVVEKSYFTSYLKDLPICVVNDFRDLTPQFLSSEYERIMSGDWNLKKLTREYWINRINADAV